MRWTTEERKWCWSSDDMHRVTHNRVFKESTWLPEGSLTALALKGNAQEGQVFGSTLATWCPGISAGSAADWVVAEEILSLGDFGVLTLLYPA